MSFLDLYQGDQAQAAGQQPNEATHLPTGFGENVHAAWSDGLLFSQSIARQNARNAVLGDYVDEIRQKTGQDLSKEFIPDVAGGGQTGVTDFDQANQRVAKLKQDYPDLDLAPLDEAEIDRRAVAKAQAAHRTYESLQSGERTTGGAVGSFLGSAGAAAADPINILALGVAPEAQGISVLSSALRWGALAGVSQAAIEFSSDQFKEQVQPGYQESGAPLQEIGGAFLGGALLGGGIKALGNAWTRVKTGSWPTSVRDAGNVIESEANVAQTNIFPGAEGEVAHREALVKTIDDILAGRPVDVGAQITPEMMEEASKPSEMIRFYHGTAYEDASGFTGETFVTPHYDYAKNYHGNNNNVLYADMSKEEAIQRGLYDEINGYPRHGPIDDGAAILKPLPKPGPPEQLPLPLEPATAETVPPEAPPRVRVDPNAPQAPLQTADEMAKTLAAPDHQDAIRADIDRARAMGDVQVPGIDENGNHTMLSVDSAMDQVDAYKAAAEQIQACANPPAEEEAA